jgi:hypothetical protein
MNLNYLLSKSKIRPLNLPKAKSTKDRFRQRKVCEKMNGKPGQLPFWIIDCSGGSPAISQSGSEARRTVWSKFWPLWRQKLKTDLRLAITAY